MLESSIERKACSEAKKLGVRNVKMNTLSDTGWPDRMFLIPGGRPLFIEFKRPGGELSPKQQYVHDLLKSLGYTVETHDNVATVLTTIKNCLTQNSRSFQLRKKHG